MSKSAHLAAWRVAEEAFPRDGSPAEQLRFLACYAILAPSIHNTQPWRFRIHGDALEVYADRGRALPVADPGARTLIISCGAALFNIRVAMYYFGCTGTAQPFPEPREPDLLARISLDAQRSPAGPAGAWAALFHAIPNRVTNRGAFDPRQIAPNILGDLQEAARLEGAWLFPFANTRARAQLEGLIDEGSRVQFGNPDFRRELADWLRPYGAMDGVPRHAIGGAELPDYATALIPFVLRNFDVGRRAAVRNVRLAAGAPLLACLGTSRDDRLAWLNAGQALQRLLLTATANRLQASFLNQPIEVVRLRPKLIALIDRKGQPQILLRLGRGARRTHTPRRGLDETLAEEPGDESGYGMNA
jgi:hypothetical protein